MSGRAKSVANEREIRARVDDVFAHLDSYTNFPSFFTALMNANDVTIPELASRIGYSDVAVKNARHSSYGVGREFAEAIFESNALHFKTSEDGQVDPNQKYKFLIKGEWIKKREDVRRDVDAVFANEAQYATPGAFLTALAQANDLTLVRIAEATGYGRDQISLVFGDHRGVTKEFADALLDSNILSLRTTESLHPDEGQKKVLLKKLGRLRDTDRIRKDVAGFIGQVQKHPKEYPTFGSIFERLCVLNELSDPEVGAATGVVHGVVHMVRNGHVLPSLPFMRAVLAGNVLELPTTPEGAITPEGRAVLFSRTPYIDYDDPQKLKEYRDEVMHKAELQTKKPTLGGVLTDLFPHMEHKKIAEETLKIMRETRSVPAVQMREERIDAIFGNSVTPYASEFVALAELAGLDARQTDVLRTLPTGKQRRYPDIAEAMHRLMPVVDGNQSELVRKTAVLGPGYAPVNSPTISEMLAGKRYPLEETLRPITAVLENAGAKPEDIEALLKACGTTREWLFRDPHMVVERMGEPGNDWPGAILANIRLSKDLGVTQAEMNKRLGGGYEYSHWEVQHKPKCPAPENVENALGIFNTILSERKPQGNPAALSPEEIGKVRDFSAQCHDQWESLTVSDKYHATKVKIPRASTWRGQKG